MKKGVKLALFSILVVFLLSVSIHLTLAAEGSSTTTSLFANKVSEIFQNAIGGETNYNYFSNILSPIILFGILIFLVIFAVISQISIFSNNKGIKLAVAVVVALLASLFIDQAWINPLLNGYEAIGILILFAIPFVLLFYFVKEVIPHQRLLQHLVWFIFFIIVGVNLIINVVNGHVAKYSLEWWIYMLVLLLSGLMFLVGQHVIDILFKENLISQVSNNRSQTEAELAAEITHDEEILSGLTGAARSSLQAKINRKKAALKAMSS